MKRRAALLLASLAPLTSGCIAAVVPIAAGAALVKRHAELEGETAAKPAPVATASARSDLRIVPTSLTALPPPDAPPAAEDPAIGRFRAYALEQSEIPGAAGKRMSSIVPTASDLRVARFPCGALPPAVFLDLDPGRGSFDPLAPGQADAALGAALAELRGRGVEVVWFSRLGASFAPAVRAALVRGGLDPAGADELVLMRDIGERKQSLRDDIARRLCPIAIVGDERADFDELYLYLKDPDAAVGLDTMIDRGWFLASPFTPPAPGATP